MQLIKKLFRLLFISTEPEETVPDDMGKTVETIAWHQGVEARERNKPQEYCPYKKNGVLYQYWQKGWKFADEIITTQVRE